MAERTEREVLNALIVACRDADRGFTFAADHVLHAPLKKVFVDQAILVEAERGERAALAVYGEALNGMLPPETRDVVERQEAGIQEGLKRLQALAEAAR